MDEHVYLLELQSGKQPVNLGIFTSMVEAKAFIKTLPREKPYTVYELPVNARLTEGLTDTQGRYEHWHFGTHEVEYVNTDDEGNITDQGVNQELTWPE